MVNQSASDAACILHIGETYNSDRNEHNCLSKDDRHYVRSIHLQRNVLSCTTILFITYNTFCILYRNLTHTLNQQNSSSYHSQQTNKFNQEHDDTSCTRRSKSGNKLTRERLRKTSNDTHHND